MIQAVGDCRVTKGRVDGVEVLMVTHERAGVALVLPPLPSLELDCSAELGKKRPGLLFSAYFKRSDAYVALFSEPAKEVLSEKHALEATGARHAKKIADELKAIPREITVDGLPGAMIATVVADAPTPKGPTVLSVQFVTVRQRSSDKRVFSLWVSLGEPTPEERVLWRSYLAMPANPVVQTPEGEPLVPEAPKNAATY